MSHSKSDSGMYSIRGKRKRQSPAASRRQNQRARPGRPMKRIDDLSAPKTAKLTNWHQSNANVKSIRHWSGNESSQLEQLPNELIQQIFFCCFEVNLPRASLQLAQALSNESTYSALILFAYFDDASETPVEQKLFLPAQYNRLGLEEKVLLQKAISTCRWYTLDRVKACLPFLSRLQMAQAWCIEKQAEETIYASLQENDADIYIPVTAMHDLLQHIAPLPELDDLDGQIRHFSAKSRFLTDFDEADQRPRFPVTSESFLPRIVTWSTEYLPSGSNSGTRLCKGLEGGCSIIAARVLPDWLVKGNPWTEDKVELLRLLRQGLQFIRKGYVLEISAAAVFEGMASAIRDNRMDALLTLVELHNFAFVEWPQNSDSDMLPQSSHPLPPYLFHMAAEAGIQSSAMMWLLVRAELNSISKDDPILTAWTLHGQAIGDSVANWLLTFMSDTSTYSTHGGPNLFKHGRLVQAISTEQLPPCSSTFADELGYLRGRTDITPRNLKGQSCG